MVFKNYPLNQFQLRMRDAGILPRIKEFNSPFKANYLNGEEIASFFHFPKNPKNETSLLTVKSKKLALPIGIPTFDYTTSERGEVVAKSFPNDVNIVGISDYRSITVPIGVY
ncbi:hypothetical protein KKH82_06845, partial [Patescibacteria group bacterium]|nr:hypothetical protein [Patescibacteria group bacterium]